MQRTVDEVRYAGGRLARPRDTRTDTRWGQRKSCWLPGYGNNAICCAAAADEQAGLTERKCSAPVSDN